MWTFPRWGVPQYHILMPFSSTNVYNLGAKVRLSAQKTKFSLRMLHVTQILATFAAKIKITYRNE
jgi:hypothetical protein